MILKDSKFHIFLSLLDILLHLYLLNIHDDLKPLKIFYSLDGIRRTAILEFFLFDTD